MFRIYTDPDHPDYDPFYNPELRAEAAPCMMYLKGQPVRALHCHGEPLWISIEDVESILSFELEEKDSYARLTMISGGAK